MALGREGRLSNVVWMMRTGELCCCEWMRRYAGRGGAEGRTRKTNSKEGRGKRRSKRRAGEGLKWNGVVGVGVVVVVEKGAQGGINKRGGYIG